MTVGKKATRRFAAFIAWAILISALLPSAHAEDNVLELGPPFDTASTDCSAPPPGCVALADKDGGTVQMEFALPVIGANGHAVVLRTFTLPSPMERVDFALTIDYASVAGHIVVWWFPSWLPSTADSPLYWKVDAAHGSCSTCSLSRPMALSLNLPTQMPLTTSLTMLNDAGGAIPAGNVTVSVGLWLEAASGIFTASAGVASLHVQSFTATLVPARETPDLLVPQVQIDSGYVEGPIPTGLDPYHITTHLKNAGTRTAQDAVVDIWLNNSYPQSTTNLGGRFTILPGDTLVIDRTFEVISEGYYDLTVRVDPANDLDETQEGNNQPDRQTHFLTLPRFQPTLIFDDEPQNIQSGQSVVHYFALHNSGTRDDTFQLNLQGIGPGWIVTGIPSAVSDPVGWPPVYLQMTVTAGEGARGSSDITLTAKSTWDPTKTATAHATTNILVGGSTQAADLVVMALSISPNQPREGDTVTVTARIANTGDFAAPATYVEFWRDDCCTVGGDWVRTPALDPGQSTVISTQFVAPAGLFMIGAYAEVGNEVPEWSETNNMRTIQVTMGGSTSPQAGVDVSPPSQTKSVPARGTATYTLSVKNTGAAQDTFDLTASGAKNGWSSSLSTSSVTLAAGASTTITLTTTAGNAGSLTVTVTATSHSDSSKSDPATCRTSVQK